MTIYVDELPKKCAGCKFCTSNYYCTLIHKDVFDYDKKINKQSRYSKCPLKIITEHDKQVRKEVLDELLNMLADRAELIKTGEVAEFMFTTYDLQESIKQIQGEPKCQRLT